MRKILKLLWWIRKNVSNTGIWILGTCTKDLYVIGTCSIARKSSWTVTHPTTDNSRRLRLYQNYYTSFITIYVWSDTCLYGNDGTLPRWAENFLISLYENENQDSLSYHGVLFAVYLYDNVFEFSIVVCRIAWIVIQNPKSSSKGLIIIIKDKKME